MSLRFAAAGIVDHYGQFYAEGPRGAQAFALTYDDGPGAVTEDLVKLLGKYGARAAFFMNGGAVRRHPERAAAAAAGHIIGNHTDTHANYFQIGKKPDREKFLAAELDRAAASIEKATGKRPRFLRMPNGYDRAWVRKVAAEKRYIIVNWTYGSDWTRSEEAAMTAEYLRALGPGAILLMHDGGGKAREKTLRLTEAVLIEAARRGLKPVGLDELLGIPAE